MVTQHSDVEYARSVFVSLRLDRLESCVTVLNQSYLPYITFL